MDMIIKHCELLSMLYIQINLHYYTLQIKMTGKITTPAACHLSHQWPVFTESRLRNTMMTSWQTKCSRRITHFYNIGEHLCLPDHYKTCHSVAIDHCHDYRYYAWFYSLVIITSYSDSESTDHYQSRNRCPDQFQVTTISHDAEGFMELATIYWTYHKIYNLL